MGRMLAGPLHDLRRRARRMDDANRHLLTMLSGQALRLALGLVSSAILARGLGPEGLSVFSVVSAALLIALTFADFGLSNSAVRHLAAELSVRPARALAIGRVYAGLKLAVAGGMVTATVLLAAPTARLLGLPAEGGPLFVLLAALGALATACSGVVSTIQRALRRFGQLVAMQTLNVALTVLLFGLLFFSGRLTVAGALLTGAVAAFAAAVLGWLLQPAAWRRALQRPALRSGPLGRRLWHFGRWLWLSNLLVIVFMRIDLLLLNRLADAEATGQYALALNLALKAGVLNQTLHMVLLPAVSALAGWTQFAAYMRSSLRRSCLLALALLLALPLARPFILTVYGEVFAPAAPLFYLLLGVMIFEIIVDPLLMLAYPLDMARHIAVSYMVRVAVMALLGSIMVPAMGPPGAALAKLGAQLAGALFLGSFLALRLRGERM